MQTPESERSNSQSPPEILREWLVDKIGRNPSYSLRAMARNMGVSPGFLSQVMSGKKRLSLDRAIQLSDTLNLTPEQTDDFLSAVKDQKLSVSAYTPVEADRFKVLSQWYHTAILDLSETKDFKSDVAWIARRLKISQIQVQDAVARLLGLELLTEKNGKWRKSQKHIAFASKHASSAIREYHKQMISKGLECLADASKEAFDRRSVTGITVSTNPEKLKKAFAVIDQFRRKMADIVVDDEATEVYQLNIQFFNLSHPLDKE